MESALGSDNNLKNKDNEFGSISKMESYALNHFAYSTPFNYLFMGKINKKRKRIFIIIVILNWILPIELLLWMIPQINQFVSYFTVNYTEMFKDDKNSILIQAIGNLAAVFYFQTDFAWNESEAHYLREINRLKNGWTNRLSRTNITKMKMRSELIYKIVFQFMIPFIKLSSMIFNLSYYIIGYNFYNNNHEYGLPINIIYCMIWMIGIDHVIDLAMIYMSFASLGIYYLKLRFNQINEKLMKVYKIKSFKSKYLLKIILEHKSIEFKVKLCNSNFNRCAAAILFGMTLAFIANLYIIIFSQNQFIRLYSFSLSISLFVIETIILVEIMSLTISAHKSYTIINSFFVKKKINLKTKSKVRNTQSSYKVHLLIFYFKIFLVIFSDC